MLLGGRNIIQHELMAAGVPERFAKFEIDRRCPLGPDASAFDFAESVVLCDG
jgi:hypothetical protein